MYVTLSSYCGFLLINYSDPSSNRGNQAREEEEATILWWEEFLDNLDQSDPQGLLPQRFIFITVANNIPVLGFPKNIDIDFFDVEPSSRRFPMASTCGLQLQSPRGIHSFDEFEELIVRALKEGSHGFGKI